MAYLGHNNPQSSLNRFLDGTNLADFIMCRLRLFGRTTTVINHNFRHRRANNLLTNRIFGRTLVGLEFSVAARRNVRRHLQVKFMRMVPKFVFRVVVV